MSDRAQRAPQCGHLRPRSAPGVLRPRSCARSCSTSSCATSRRAATSSPPVSSAPPTCRTCSRALRRSPACGAPRSSRGRGTAQAILPQHRRDDLPDQRRAPGRLGQPLGASARPAPTWHSIRGPVRPKPNRSQLAGTVPPAGSSASTTVHPLFRADLRKSKEVGEERIRPVARLSAEMSKRAP